MAFPGLSAYTTHARLTLLDLPFKSASTKTGLFSVRASERNNKIYRWTIGAMLQNSAIANLIVPILQIVIKGQQLDLPVRGAGYESGTY